MKRQLRFIAHYENETVQGNPLGNRDSLWTSLPGKPIKALEYILPHANDSIKLCGYEEYLHMVEVCMPMGGNAMIEYVYLMGKTGATVVSYRITILQKTKNDRYKIGDITVRVMEAGKEYRGGATTGWKAGIKQESK